MRHTPIDMPRDAEIRRFVRARYGLKGTLSLHRAALPWDMLRAPVNVTLSPFFLLIRLGAGLARLCRLPRLGQWLDSRRIFLPLDLRKEQLTERASIFVGRQASGIA